MKFRTIIAGTCIVACMGFLVSCGLVPIIGDGILTTESRLPQASFNAIETSGAYEITVLTGQKETGVTIVTDGNLQTFIESKVENNTLSIETKPFTWLLPTSKIMITINVLEITEISNSGAGTLTIPSYTTASPLAIYNSGANSVSMPAFSSSSSFSIDSSGVGSITVAGNCASLNLDSSGTGSIDASGLAAGTVTLDISGTCSIRVNAATSLTGSFSGVGSLYNAGTAPNTVSCSGVVTLKAF